MRRLLCRTRKSEKVTNVLGNIRFWHEADELLKPEGPQCARSGHQEKYPTAYRLQTMKI